MGHKLNDFYVMHLVIDVFIIKRVKKYVFNPCLYESNSVCLKLTLPCHFYEASKGIDTYSHEVAKIT